MRRFSRCSVPAVAVLFYHAGVLPAQQFFYDSKRDQQTQEAVTAVKDVSESGLFNKMLSNAARQLAVESGTIAEWQRILGQGSFDTIRVWNTPLEKPASGVSFGGVGTGCLARRLSLTHGATDRCDSLRCKLDELEMGLVVKTGESDLTQQVDDLKRRIGELEKQIAVLEAEAKKSSDTPLALVAAQLSSAKTLLGFVEKAQKAGVIGKSEALGEIGSAIDQIQSAVGIVQGIWAGYNALKPAPGELVPLHQELDVALLKIEIDRISQLAIVYGRLHLDTGRVKDAIVKARHHLSGVLDSADLVEDTLARLASGAGANAVALDRTLQGLHYAALAFASADLSVKLCSIREGGLERQATIRRGAVEVAAREGSAREGLERLALYYKSGIKPSELANLIFSILGATALPAAAR